MPSSARLMQSIERAAKAAVVLCLAAAAMAQTPAAPASGKKLPLQGPTWQTVEPQKTSPPPVKIEPDVIELGDLMPNTKVASEFKITNVGAEPLYITAAMSTCSCTVAELREKGIEPGKTVVLPITFESGPVLSTQERDIVIRFDGYSKSAIGKVRASTNYGVRTAVEYTPPEQRRIGIVTLTSVDGEPFRVLSADGATPEFLDGDGSTPRSRYEVKMDLSRYEAEKLPKWFVIETNHATSPIIDLPVENQEWEPERTLRPWSMAESRVLLGVIPPMAQRDVVVTAKNVTSGGLDFVKNVWVEPENADVSIFGMEQAEDGLKIRLRVSPKATQHGAFVTKVNISALDFEDGVTLMGRIADPGSEN